MAASVRSRSGKIIQLITLIDEHKAAFYYDWRDRFGLPLSSVFTGEGGMTWDEAWDLFTILATDPTSYVGAALSEMDYPFSHEAFIGADLFDLMMQINTPKKHKSRIKPYPRPIRHTGRNVTKSKKPTADRAAVIDALAARGH